MDILRPLRAVIDTANGSVELDAEPDTPSPEPNTQTTVAQLVVHQPITLPPRAAKFVTIPHGLGDQEVLFQPGNLPDGITSETSLSQGKVATIRLTNLRQDPFVLTAGSALGTVSESVPICSTSLRHPSMEHHQPLGLPDVPPELPTRERHQLQQLLYEFRDVFAQHEDDVGRTQLVQHQIKTTGPPIRVPARRQNPVVRAAEEAEIQKMLRQDIISPSQSPWASPIVMVRKKNGDSRLCIDYRQLNEQTIKDAHPLPRIDDSLEALHGAKYFSTLDLKAGYWQVPVAPEDQEKTAFRTSSGQLYECRMMPFGLCNAPATFSRLMDHMLTGLKWEICLAYLDDLIVFSRTWEEHLDRLHQVLTRIRETGVKLQPSKCTLARDAVDFLGHTVSSRGIQPNPALLQAIRDIPAPGSIRDLRSFLGLTGYYRRFVPGYAKIAQPLTSLLQQGQPWVWGEAQQTAFRDLEERLLREPVTAYPDFRLPFRLYTDASALGIGAILAQIQDGKERIICCASRTMNAGEKNYSATKMECLAVVWGIKKFRHFLVGVDFEVFTDHHALQWLKTMKINDNALLHRWKSELEDFSFVIRHRPGKSQAHVDALSRLHPQAGVANIEELPAEVQEELKTLNTQTQRGERPGHTSLRGYSYDQEGRVLMGPKGTKYLLHVLHHSAANHLGSKKLQEKFKERYAGTQVRALAEEVTGSCEGCQRGSDYKARPPPARHITAEHPWHTLSIDVMGPFPKNQGHQWIISVIDVFSRFLILFPAADHTADTVASGLLQHVIAYFGVPTAILSDRGAEFRSRIWARLQERLGCRMTMSSPYYPQGNSVVERSHRTINNVLRATLLESPEVGWKDALPAVQLTLNTAIHEAHGFAPAQLLTGNNLRLPADCHLGAHTNNADIDPKGHLEKKLQAMSACRQVAQHYVAHPPQPDRTNPFKVGDNVLVAKQPHALPHKLAAKWEGPFEVTGIPNPSQVHYRRADKEYITSTKYVKKFTSPASRQPRGSRTTYCESPVPTPASSPRNEPSYTPPHRPTSPIVSPRSVARGESPATTPGSSSPAPMSPRPTRLSPKAAVFPARNTESSAPPGRRPANTALTPIPEATTQQPASLEADAKVADSLGPPRTSPNGPGGTGTPCGPTPQQGEASTAPEAGQQPGLEAAPTHTALNTGHSGRSTPSPEPLIRSSRSGRVISRPRYLQDYTTSCIHIMASIRPDPEKPAIIAVCGENRIRLTGRRSYQWMSSIRRWKTKDLPILFFAPTDEPRLRRLRDRIQPDASAWKYSPSHDCLVFISGCGQPLFLGGSDVSPSPAREGRDRSGKQQSRRRERRTLQQGSCARKELCAVRTDQPRAAGSEEHRQRSTTRPAPRAGSHTGGEYKEDPKQGSADGRGSDNSPDRLPTLSAWQSPKGEVSPLSAWQSPKGPSHYPVHGRGSDNSPDRLSPLCLGRSAIPPPVSVRPSPPTGTFPCPLSHQAPPAAVAARGIPAWRRTRALRPLAQL